MKRHKNIILIAYVWTKPTKDSNNKIFKSRI